MLSGYHYNKIKNSKKFKYLSLTSFILLSFAVSEICFESNVSANDLPTIQKNTQVVVNTDGSKSDDTESSNSETSMDGVTSKDSDSVDTSEVAKDNKTNEKLATADDAIAEKMNGSSSEEQENTSKNVNVNERSYRSLYSGDENNLTGVQTINDETYYYDPVTHVKKTDFFLNQNGNIYYFGTDGSEYRNKFYTNWGNTYYFGESGVRYTDQFYNNWG